MKGMADTGLPAGELAFSRKGNQNYPNWVSTAICKADKVGKITQVNPASSKILSDANQPATHENKPFKPSRLHLD